MYFPLIVHEALMVEPTETESKETLDEAWAVFLKLLELAHAQREGFEDAPVTTRPAIPCCGISHDSADFPVPGRGHRSP